MAISNPSCSSITKNSMTVTWDITGISIFNEWIFHSVNSGSWDGGTRIGNGDESYNATSLTEGALHSWYISVDSDGDGGGDVTSFPGSGTTLIPAPTIGNATVVSKNAVNVAWSDNSLTETGFEVYWKGLGDGSWSLGTTASAGATNVQINSLTEGLYYDFRVRAVNAVTNSDYSGSDDATTTLTAPTIGAATTVSASVVSVAWTDNSATESGFEVYYKASGGAYALFTTTAAGATSQQVSGLTMGTLYYFKVRAKNTSTVSEYSGESSSITTLTEPTIGTATATGISSIDVTWTDNSSTETGFEVYFKATGGSYSLAATTGAGAVSYSKTGLGQGTLYYFKVRAVNAIINSAYSGEVSAITAISEPTIGTATANSGSTITVTWADNSTTETGFEVYWKANVGVYALATTTAGNAVSYQKTGLTQGTLYYFKVRAVNAIINSDYSGEASATTPLVSPTIGTATTNSSTAITVTWVDNSDNETGFEVYWKADGGSYALATTTAAGATSYQKTGLAHGTLHYFYVRAVNAIVNSDNSGAVSATTTLPAPTIGTATSTGYYSITVTWSDNSNSETGFEVYFKATGGSYSLGTTTAAGATSYNKTGLDQNQQYYFKVRAVNAIVSSDYSGEVYATTDRVPITYSDNIGDYPTISDSETDSLIASDAFSDTSTITDSVTTAYATFDTVTDTATASESVDEWKGYGDSVSDTSSISDSATDMFATASSDSDSVTITDLLTDVITYVDVISDTVTASDTTASASSLGKNYRYYWGTSDGYTYETLPDYTDDDGTIFTASWRSKTFDGAEGSDMVGIWKTLYKIEYLYKDLAANTPVVISVSNDGGNSWDKIVSATVGSGNLTTAMKNYFYVFTGQFFDVKVEWPSGATEFQFLGLVAEVEPNGPVVT